MSFEVLLRRGPPSDHIAAQARREKNQAPGPGAGAEALSAKLKAGSSC